MSQRPGKHFVIPSVLLLLLFVSADLVRGDISRSQARKVITRVAGFELPTSAVRITAVNSTAADAAEASADLQLVFRLVQDAEGFWQIQEVRSGQDRWEDVTMIATGAKFELPKSQCSIVKTNGRRDSELHPKRIRCLVAELFGINLPSDAVRVKEFSSLNLPVGTESSALAVVFVRADFRLRRDASAWQVTEFKSGNREWINVTGLSSALEAAKRTRADQELRTMASALESYRKDRGHYLATDKHSILIDHLSPHYLSKVLRLDPWHHPYRYHGESQRFTLRSVGPDGRPDTPDDITVSDSTR